MTEPRLAVLPGTGALFAAALPLAALFHLSAAVSAPVALVSMLALSLVVAATGWLLLSLARADDLPATAVWVAGLAATCLALYVLVECLPITAAAAGAVWAVCVAAGVVIRRKEVGRAVRCVAASDLIALLVCGGVTYMWCSNIADAPELLSREGTLYAWIDHFIHGGVISSFGDPRAIGRGAIDMLGYPRFAYHYASYVLPAVLAAPLDLPGLPLSTSVWLPLGFFTMCCGLYTLGAALAGPAGGLAAVASVTLLPDASNYGLRNGLFSFHWNVLVSPGAGYAVGTFALAAVLLQRWQSGGSRRVLALSAGLAGGLALLRVHVFALAFPAWVAVAAGFSAVVRRHQLLSFVVAALAFVAFVLSYYYELTDQAPAFELFMAAVHNLQEPTGYSGWYVAMVESLGPSAAALMGIPVVFAAALGVVALVYPITLALRLRRAGLDALSATTLALAAVYVLLMVAAPISGHGDPTELTQRPFVVLYAFVTAWTAASLTGMLAAGLGRHAPRAPAGMLGVCLLGAILIGPITGQLTSPKFYWGWRFHTHQVAEGLPEASAFLRAKSRPGEAFAVQGVPLGWVATDVATQIISLTGLPAYIARPFIHVSKHGAEEAETLRRYNALHAIAAEADFQAAMRRIAQLGVQWYVVRGAAGPRWDPGRRSAVFVKGDIAVYAAGSHAK